MGALLNLESFGRINQGNGLPLHLQLERILREQIKSMKPGDRLPTEKELREHFGLSSSTVRQALQSLVNQGLVYRKVARGSFVASQPIQEELSELLGFFQMARRKGIEPGCKLIEACFAPAPEEVAAALRIPPRDEIFKVVRVRYADGEPVCVETTFFSRQLGLLLAKEDLATVAFYPILEEKHGIRLVAAREVIGASIVSSADAELLQIPKRSAVLTMERITYLPEDVPSEVAFHVYRADRYRYGVWRRRNQNSPAQGLEEIVLS